MQIGQKIIHLDTVDSTNNYAANLLKSGNLKSGTVILADDQFAGRGQRTNHWSANARENLTFSIVLTNVNMSVTDQYRLTEIISFTMVDYLDSIGISATIKWPNDIMIDRKKIAGILVENQIGGESINNTIIGVGLNVNQIEFEGFIATSIRKEKGHEFSIREVLFGIIEKFNMNWMSLMKIPYNKLDRLYHENLFLLGQIAPYKDAQGGFEGQIIGVETNGRLKVKKGTNTVYYMMKEIEFIL